MPDVQPTYDLSTYIRVAVAKAPPLTEEQRDTLRALLTPRPFRGRRRSR